MNFKRIEWIFLIAFIALDIFLVGSFTQQARLLSVTNTSPTSSTALVLRNIKEDQITYGKLPDKREWGYYVVSPETDVFRNKPGRLHDENWTDNNQGLTATFATAIHVNVKHPTRVLNSVIRTRVVNGKQYRYDRQLSTKNQVVYTQSFKGVPALTQAGQVRFNVRNGIVTGYTQGYVRTPRRLPKKQRMISAKRALIALYQYNKINSNSTVQWVRLGYTKLLAANQHVIYVPTWVFSIRSKTTGNVTYRQINAFTGAVMDKD